MKISPSSPRPPQRPFFFFEKVPNEAYSFWHLKKIWSSTTILTLASGAFLTRFFFGMRQNRHRGRTLLTILIPWLICTFGRNSNESRQNPFRSPQKPPQTNEIPTAHRYYCWDFKRRSSFHSHLMKLPQTNYLCSPPLDANFFSSPVRAWSSFIFIHDMRLRWNFLRKTLPVGRREGLAFIF